MPKRKEYRKSFGVISPPPLARSSDKSTTGSASIFSKIANTPRPAVVPAPMRTESHSENHEAPRGPESTPQNREVSLETMITRLKSFAQQMGQDQDAFTIYKLQEAFQGIKKAPDRRKQRGEDLFARCRKPSVWDEQEDTMCVETRYQTKGKIIKDAKHHIPILCDTEMKSVPEYMYRYVSIAKTLLAPASDQAQISQIQDFKTNTDRQDFEKRVAEIKDNNAKLWNSEPLRKQQIFDLTAQLEKSHAIAACLQAWLEELSIPVSALLSSQSSNQGNQVARAASVSPALPGSSAKFKKAFCTIFCANKQSNGCANGCATLNRVVQLAHQETSETTWPRDLDKQTDAFLLSYCFQSCLICHQYACEHGEFNSENLRERIKFPHVPELLTQRRQNRVNMGRHHTASSEVCVCQMPSGPQRNKGTPWTAEESKVLMTTAITSQDHMNMGVDPACIVATTLSRSYEEVREKLQGMDLSRPEPTPTHLRPPKPLPFYDRQKKRLVGAWDKKLMSHKFAERKLVDRSGCHHEGPCTVESCQCRQLKLLCEKFCTCTESSCAAKFTGCGCKAANQNCTDWKCICIQLGRECDPDLCGSCGIVEQCDPWRHRDPENKDKRCINSDLQTARPKATVKADSEIEGAGYGLLIAEAAKKGEFVIEYIGEWEPYDEGERRTIRRDNADTESNAPSYLFTVLEGEAFEIDSAAYGNMSRFFNSATPSRRPGTKQSANVVPQIVYVNGEFRIKFVATRDIKVGEELFFSYGKEYFGKVKQPTKPKKSVSEADKRIAKARAPIQRMTAVPEDAAEAETEGNEGSQPHRRRNSPESPQYRDSESDDADSESDSDEVASANADKDQDDGGQSASASAARPRRLESEPFAKKDTLPRGRRRRRDSREDDESTRPKKQQRTNTYGISVQTTPASWATATPSSQASKSQEQQRTRSSVRSAGRRADKDDLVPVVNDSQEDDGEEIEGQSSQGVDEGEGGEDEEEGEEDEESEEDETPAQVRRLSQRSRRRPQRFKSVAFDKIRK